MGDLHHVELIVALKCYFYIEETNSYKGKNEGLILKIK